MTDASPVWLDLGADAIDPALAELWFDDPFSATLTALTKRVEGRLCAYVPQSVDLERAMQFRAGGLLPEGERHRLPDGSSIAAVESLIEVRDRRFFRLLTDNPGAACIIPESNPLPTDPDPPSGPTVFWVGDRCFHWLDHMSDQPSLIETFANAELPWCAIAAVCRPAGGAQRTAVMDEVELIRLAEAAIEVSLRAYDGESFLIWSRADTDRA